MSYQTYTTEAIVCGNYPEREHDATLRLFTKEAGMIFARAGGVRADKSKLRYGLQPFSHARITLVRGKMDWRVTGAVALDNFYYRAHARNARAQVLAGMRSVRRLIHGTDVHPELFMIVRDGLTTLAETEHELSEPLFLLRLLHHLGYVPPQVPYAPLLHTETLSGACEHCISCAIPLGTITRTIENALVASHL